MKNTIRTQIFELIDPNIKNFQQRLIPNIDNVLGVRLPELRKIAKKIAKDDWRTYLKQPKVNILRKLCYKVWLLAMLKRILMTNYLM